MSGDGWLIVVLIRGDVRERSIKWSELGKVLDKLSHDDGTAQQNKQRVTGMNGVSANANLLGVEGNPSSSSTDQQQMFAAAMLRNPSPTSATITA
ncbi:hypothetical protein niasHT_021711 [Heterodera trifolii]|uniref:Uncharacterized protein n=1 Tax=Heterodera trifolii TaxID=157864 RepID=A0ABD2KRW2_9BILA